MQRFKRALVAASLALAVGMAGAATAGPSPSHKCAAAKQKAAGKKGACRLGCTANATLKGLALNAPTITACLGTCDTKFRTAFTKAEAKGGCHTTGDATTIEGKVDAFVMDVVSELPVEGGITMCVQPFRPVAADVLDGFSFRLDPSGNFDVPASCGGTPALCCPGGNPVSPCGPLQFDFVQRAGESSATLVPSSDPDLFDFDVPARLKTVTDIPVNILGLDCGLRIDTSPGSSPRIEIFGRVAFSADRLRMGPVTNVSVTGLTTDDVAVTGGIACQTASLGIGAVLSTLVGVIQDDIATNNDLCRLCCSNAIAQCGP